MNFNTMEMKDLYCRKIKTPLGELVAMASQEYLYFLQFGDKEGLEQMIDDFALSLPAAWQHGDNIILNQLQTELDVPYGSTHTYKQIAQAVANPKAMRAVGHANGLNRILLIVPCHRIVGEQNSPTGYSAGIWRKNWLIEHESRFVTMLKAKVEILKE